MVLESNRKQTKIKPKIQTVMSTQRKQKLEAQLARLEEIERELTSQGKKVSKTFIAMKQDLIDIERVED